MSTTAAPTTTPALPLTPGLRRVLTGVVLVAVVLGVASGANSLVQVMARHTSTLPVRTYTDVRSVRIEADAGDVTVRQGPAGSSVRVRERVTRGIGEPRRQQIVTDAGQLRLVDDCQWWNQSCAVSYDVTVPRGTTVGTLSSSSGDVRVTGVRTDQRVRLATDSGSIRTDGLRAPSVSADADSGDVDLARVVAPTVTARSDSGDVRLRDVRSRTIEASTDSGELLGYVPVPPRLLSLRSDSGGAQAYVPVGAYRIDARTDSGSVSNDEAVRNDPRAERRIVMRSDSGDVDYQANRRDNGYPPVR